MAVGLVLKLSVGLYDTEASGCRAMGGFQGRAKSSPMHQNLFSGGDSNLDVEVTTFLKSGAAEGN